MQTEHEKIFVSYSWDSDEHQEWVAYLVRSLRKEGYDATYDQYITSQNTINLNRMMVERIKNDDYVILVVTENYTKKADEFIGGVGFESELLLPVIRDNRDKVIVITKQFSKSKKIPFYLEGYNYIDFSEGSFEDALDNLICRLQKTPVYDIGDIGEKKIRTPRLPNIKDSNNIAFFNMPNSKNITDLDRNRYINQSFEEINKQLCEIFKQVSTSNSSFEFEVSKITDYKKIFDFYNNGNLVHKLKLWIGSHMGSSSKHILYSIGNFVSIDNDTSSNGYILLNEELAFSMPMNYMKQGKELSINEVVEEIYSSNILPYIK